MDVKNDKKERELKHGPAPLPTDPTDLTLEVINHYLSKHNPGAVASSFSVTESHAVRLGHAPSAGRICIDVDYARDVSPKKLCLR